MNKAPHYNIVKRDEDIRITARKFFSSNGNFGSLVQSYDGCTLSEMERLLRQITALTEELNETRLEAARTRDKLAQAEGIIWRFLEGQEVVDQGTAVKVVCDASTSTESEYLNNLQSYTEDTAMQAQVQAELLSVKEAYEALKVENQKLVEAQAQMQAQLQCQQCTEAQQEEHKLTVTKLNQSYGAAVIRNNTLERQLKETRHMLVETEKRAAKQMQELRDVMTAEMAVKDAEIQRLSSEAKCIVENKRVRFLSPIPTQSDDSIGLKPLRKVGMSVKQISAQFMDSDLIL